MNIEENRDNILSVAIKIISKINKFYYLIIYYTNVIEELITVKIENYKRKLIFLQFHLIRIFQKEMNK